MSERVVRLAERLAPSTAVERKVRVLPREVADRIAAGEVVERPASVVKELVENALDAGAVHIRIELEDAGLGLIAVMDDGEGMTAEDARCAFERHATSKIRTLEDLQRIVTFGFRGEALASIAAVSTTTLITRRREELAGTRLVVRAGRIVEQSETGAAPGTRVEVTDLFAHVPARRKFLKAPATEVGHVSETVTRFALAFPRVSFVLKHGTRTLLDYPSSSSAEERLAQVFGRDRAALMIPFAAEAAAGRIWGYLADPHFTLPSPRQIFTYVNGRNVRDRLLVHALTAGYTTLLMHGRYPAAVLFVEVDPGEVDVNVHPAKVEVRFRRAAALHDLLVHGVQEALRSHVPVGEDEAGADGTPPSALVPRSGTRNMPAAAATVPPWIVHPPWRTAPAPNQVVPLLPPARRRRVFSGLRVIGQVFEGYWVCEGADALYLIDQHAAHERVVFERLRRSYGAGELPRQQLLAPEVVEVGPAARARLEECQAQLLGLGFELEAFGHSAVLVRSLPVLLGQADPGTLVRDLAEELVEMESPQLLHEAMDRVFARLACHSAVRVGQLLSREQIEALLQAMDEAELPGNCPHGRPAFLSWPRGELERLFRRV